MKIKPSIIGFLVLCLIIPNIIAPASAATPEVKVTIPKFAVEVNGKKIDNKHTRYPILVYKEMTYFPMTLDYAAALGLSIQWHESTGLTIKSLVSRMPLKEDKSGNNSLSKTYNAQIALFPIKVNDEKIINPTEKYPLLLFREITYFPMTWRFTNDLFHWRTEWNAATGYHIRSIQVPVILKILYDDDNFLYVRTGTEGIYKISKVLDGKYTRLNYQENKTITEKLQARSEENATPHSFESTELIAIKGEFLYYKDQELLSLEPYLKKIEESRKTDPETSAEISYNVNLTKLDDDNTLLILRVYYLNHVPAPYTPHEEHVFVIHKDKASKIDGYTQWPDKLIKNMDGSFWISSYAPPAYDIDTRNFDRLGQLALIDKNGMSYNINHQLKVNDIDVLYADNQSILIKAFNDRFDPSKATKSDGFYKIETSLSASKLADSIQGIGYVDKNKQAYVLNPDKNTITNVTTKKSHTWWDYELIPDFLTIK